jgi:hypothetical protein
MDRYIDKGTSNQLRELIKVKRGHRQTNSTNLCGWIQIDAILIVLTSIEFARVLVHAFAILLVCARVAQTLRFLSETRHTEGQQWLVLVLSQIVTQTC